MGDRPKVHVFLGAPPPSSSPGSAPEVGVEGVWRHLELTWRDGRLKAAADDAGNEPGAAERSDQDQDQDLNPGTDPPEPSLQIQDGPRNSEADWTTETVQGPEGQAGEFSSEEESLNKDQASVHEYLDSCFSVGPEPERPGPEPEHAPGPGPGPGPERPGPEHAPGPGPGPERPGPEPEHGPGPGPGSGPETERPRLKPGHGPGSEPETHGPGPGPGPSSVHPPSERTHFLSAWTLSQALVLRGRHVVQSASSPQKTPPSSSTPELFSPAAPSPEASAELFSPCCPTPRVEEGGVVLQATSDGILCSQESTTVRDSPAESPCRKKTRVCGESRTEAATRLHAATTLLARCDKSGVRYSVLVAVVHPCHLKEVQVRSGPSAGTSVPLASIVVTDQSGVEMKVVLWRRAAFWASTVSPGDVLLITALQVSEDRWRGETLLQSTFSSKLLNLGPTAASTCPPPASQQVDPHCLRSLCVFLRERRPLLVSLSRRRPQDLSRLPYAALRSLRVNTLVHALLRITHTHVSSAWRSEAESLWRSAVQVKVVLTVEQTDGCHGELILWGAAVDWLPRLRGDSASFWDFHVLLVRDGLTSDLPELHSTPWSSVRPVDPTDRRLRDVQRRGCVQRGASSTVEMDLDTLLSQKFNGDVELRVQVVSFHFQDVPLSQNAPQPVLDGGTPLDGVLAALSGDVTYTGCSRCSAELDTDANGIYCPCYPCLPHRALRRYYRRGVLTVSGRGFSQVCGGRGFSQVCVQVPPVPLQQILKVPPDKLQRSSAPGSEVKLVQVAAERIQTLLSLPKKTFIITVRSHFLCDENSVPIDQELTLLDLQFPDSL